MFKFTRIIDALFKARGHKYLKRIPYESRGKLRYRYIYKITHTHKGKHAFHEDHLVEGTKFALSTQSGEEFHGHVTSVSGDKIKYVIDDGPRKGEEVTTTREKLAKELHEKHDVHASLKGEREEVERQLAYARKKGYEKQEARLLRRLDALKPTETKKPEPTKTKNPIERALDSAINRISEYYGQIDNTLSGYDSKKRLKVELDGIIIPRIRRAFKEEGRSLTSRRESAFLDALVREVGPIVGKKTSKEKTKKTLIDGFDYAVKMVLLPEKQEEAFKVDLSVLGDTIGHFIGLPYTDRVAFGEVDEPSRKKRKATEEYVENIKNAVAHFNGFKENGVSIKQIKAFAGSNKLPTNNKEQKDIVFSMGAHGELVVNQSSTWQGNAVEYFYRLPSGEETPKQSLNPGILGRYTNRNGLSPKGKKEIPLALISAFFGRNKERRKVESPADIFKEVQQLKNVDLVARNVDIIESMKEVQTVQQKTEPPVNAPLLRGDGETLTPKQVKALKKYTQFNVLTSDPPKNIMQGGNIVGATDGKRIVYYKTGSPVSLSNVVTRQGEDPKKIGLAEIDLSKYVPDNSPIATLDKKTISAVSRVLRKLDKKSTPRIRITGENGKVSLSVAGKAIAEVSTNADLNFNPVNLNAHFFLDALKDGGKEVTLKVGSKKLEPFVVEGISGLNHTIMQVRI